MIESHVKEYAKANKCNGAKLLEFVQSIIDDMPKPQAKPMGRKAGDDTLGLRQRIREAKESGWQADGYTVVQMAQHLNASPVYVTNALKWLSEHESACRVIGKAAKPAGRRGKAPSVWSWNV